MEQTSPSSVSARPRVRPPRFESAAAVKLWLSERFAHERDPQTILALVAETLGRFLGVTRVGYGEIEPGKDSLNVLLDWTDGLASMVGRQPLFRDSPIVRDYVQGQTLIVPDIDALDLDPAERALLDATHCRSFVSVPLIHDGEFVALFSVTHRDVRRWTDEEVQLVAQTGARTWSALEYARALNELASREEQFRTLAENVPGICWIAGPDGNAFWMNQIGRDYLGGLKGSAADAHEVIHPDDLDATLAAWRHALKTGGRLEIIVRVRGTDGIYRPFLSRAEPVRDPDGKVVRWCTVQVDLSEQHAKAHRQALLRSFSDRTRELTDPDAILALLAETLGRELKVARFSYVEVSAEDPNIFQRFAWRHGELYGWVERSFNFDARLRHVLHLHRGGRIFVSDDMLADAETVPELRTFATTYGVLSAVAAPIVREGRLLASVSVLDEVPRRWMRDEIELVAEFAERGWAAIARARAEAELRIRERSQALLIQWSDQVRGLDTPEAIVGTTLTLLGEHLDVSRVTHAEADQAAGVFCVTGEWHRPDVPSIRGNCFSLPQVGAAVDRAWLAGEVIRYDDTAGDPRLEPAAKERYAGAGIGAFISVPLILEGRMHSALSVQSARPRRWQEHEVQLLREVAERTWGVLERARAEKALAARERDQAFLIDWSDQVRAQSSSAAILDLSLARLGEHLGAARTLYAEGTGEDQDHLVLADWGPGLPSLSGKALPAADPSLRLTMPLARGDSGRAMLAIEQAAPHPWTDREIQLAREAADRICDMLERARAEEALKARERDRAFLLDWSDAMRAETSPDAVVRVTLERLARHLDTSRANFAEREDGGFAIVQEWRRESEVDGTLNGERAGISDGLTQAYLAGEIVVVEDVHTDPRISPESRARYAAVDAVAFLGIPLVRGGSVRAVLSVQCRERRTWLATDIQLLRDVADRTWVSLERARAEAALQERERNQAFLIEWSDRVRGETSPRAILDLTLDLLGRHLGVSRANYAEATRSGNSLEVLQEWRDGLVTVLGQRFPLSAFGDAMLARHLSGEPVIIADTHAHPLIPAATQAIYDRVRIGSFLSIPLIRHGAMEAVLSVQQDRPRRWTENEVALVRDIADRTWAVIERARSEERLAESEALLAAFMENAPLGMHLKDASGRYIRINPELAEAIGRPMEEIVGAHPDELFPPAVAEVIEGIEAHARAGELASAEFHSGGDGERWRSVMSMVFPIKGRGIARTAGLTIDITERKQAEDALARSREALYQTEKLSALGSLLAGVSHELNNPLSIVVAQAVMMERQARGTEIAERAQKVRRAADRCARIVQTFLAMARQKHPEREPVDLNGVVTAALDLADYGLRTEGVALTKQLAPDLPPIPADADQIHQIVINLVINAQQAMVQAGVADRHLTITTARGPEPDTVILDIADNGPGVPVEVQRRIFEPFYTTKPQGEGTGVGLSFSQGLAEAHGGRLTLVPTPVGATFRLTLPIDPGHTLPKVAPDVAQPAPAILRRALVIDDEEEIAESLADFLTCEGYRPEIALGGRAAIERLEGGDQFDLIVSDLRMPDIDGPQLHAWIARERPELLPRLAFATGDTLGVAVARFLEGAQRPVLEKPFMPDAVTRFLQQVESA